MADPISAKKQGRKGAPAAASPVTGTVTATSPEAAVKPAPATKPEVAAKPEAAVKPPFAATPAPAPKPFVKPEPVAVEPNIVAAPNPVAPAPVAPAPVAAKPAPAPAPIVEAKPVPAPAPVVAAAPAPVISTPAAPVEVVAKLLNAPRLAAEPLTKGLHIMATTFDPAATTEKAKAMFGDINDRAKTAMEKSAKFGEEMTEFTKGNVEALVASGRVAAKGAETLAQDAAETMKKHFESVTAQMKSIAGVKSPTELFQLQSEYAKTSFDSAVADASKFSESMMKLFGDIAQPLSSRYAVAAEKIKANVA